MKRMEYMSPDAKLTLWAIDCIMAATGEGNSENAWGQDTTTGEEDSKNTWGQDTTISLPPVKLP